MPTRPRNDPVRLDALARTGLLDSEPMESFDRLTALATRILSVPVALVSFVDDRRQFFASCIGLPAGVTAQRGTPISHSFCAHVVDTSQPLVVADARQHPLLADNPAIGDLGVVAYLGIPILTSDGHVLGSLCAIDHEPRQWSEDEIATMTDLAASANTEIAMQEAVQAERAARREAEQANRRLSFIAQASALLTESLDYRTILQTIAKLAVPDVADWCAVDLLDGSRLHRLTVAHDGDGGDDEQACAAKLLLTRYAPDLDGNGDVPAVVRSGTTRVREVIDAAYLHDATRDAEHRRAMEALGFGSSVVVPLMARGRTLGVVSFVARQAGRYTDGMVPFLEDLARRMALAVDNARLYQQADAIAKTLQRSLLPPSLPQIPGVELGAAYQPAGTEVGGDFYDVFQTHEGTWLAAIGDVCGKGPRAAAVTGLARHTIRASAIQMDAPSAVLRFLNDVLLAEAAATADEIAAESTFATVCAVTFRVEGATTTATVSSGGHPAPVVRRADGSIEVVDVPGTALGLIEDCMLTDVRLELGPGDLLLLVTDGVLEARSPDGSFLGMEGLRALLRELGDAPAGEVAGRLGEDVVRWQDGHQRDDIALLALRALPSGSPAQERRPGA